MKKTNTRTMKIYHGNNSRKFENMVVRAVLKNGGYIQIKTSDGGYYTCFTVSANDTERFYNSIKAVWSAHIKHFGKRPLCF